MKDFINLEACFSKIRKTKNALNHFNVSHGQYLLLYSSNLFFRRMPKETETCLNLLAVVWGKLIIARNFLIIIIESKHYHYDAFYNLFSNNICCLYLHCTRPNLICHIHSGCHIHIFTGTDLQNSFK